MILCEAFRKTIFTDGELPVGNQLAVRKQIKETGNASCSFHAGCCPRIRQYFLYFQLRQSQGSSEKFHGAVIDHYGKDDTRVFKEVTEVGESLEKLQEVTGAKNPAQVAVVYDWENRWAMEDAQGPRNKGLFYKTVEKILLRIPQTKTECGYDRYGAGSGWL